MIRKMIRKKNYDKFSLHTIKYLLIEKKINFVFAHNNATKIIFSSMEIQKKQLFIYFITKLLKALGMI